jgi:hypothetical protein
VSDAGNGKWKLSFTLLGLWFADRIRGVTVAVVVVVIAIGSMDFRTRFSA